MTNWQDFHPTVPSISGVITFVPTIDLGALAMALQLANELDAELSKQPLMGSGVAYDFIEVSDWLRQCVAEELEAHA